MSFGTLCCFRFDVGSFYLRKSLNFNYVSGAEGMWQLLILYIYFFFMIADCAGNEI